MGASNGPISSIQKIEDNIKGSEILQLQDDHKFNWKEYTFQEAIGAVAVESIFAAVDAQYVEHLEEDYVGYKNQNIRMMVEQIQTWYVIINKEKLAIKVHFLETWSGTPDALITTSDRQLDRGQVECEDHGVTVTEANKVDHLVAHMYACDLFETIFLDDWEESNDH